MIIARIKIREAIDKFNKEQAEPRSDDFIAVMAGIHTTTLKRILDGERYPSVATLERLANYMGITDANELIIFVEVEDEKEE